MGEQENPWETTGRTPGGVVEFVDDLAQVRTTQDKPVFPADTTAGVDWIMPLRLHPDLNISRGVIERGGFVDVPNLDPTQKSQSELAGMLDGNHRVAFDRKFISGRVVRNNGIRVRIDLGARFGLNRILFYPRDTAQFPFGNDFLRAFELYVNDGLPQNLYASGQPIFTSPVVREEDNSDQIVEILIEPQFVRYIELKSISTVGFEIDEIEVYGTGFVPTAAYVSDVLDLGGPVVWGDIEWVERVAGEMGDSEAEVRVRSGSDTTPDIYYRVVQLGGGRTEQVPTTAAGEPLTRELYENELRENERGPIQTDTQNWSQWQPAGNGDQLNLPAPRRFFQFRVNFVNHELDAGRAIDRLAFSYAQPPVERIVAELSPPEAEIGATTRFTLLARVENRAQLPGFNRFEIETPAPINAIHAVELMDGDGNRLDGAEFTSDLRDLPQHQGNFSVLDVAHDHFTLGTPLIRSHGTLLRVVFDAAAYRYGTRFAGLAYPAGEGGLPLQTEGGDASPLLDTDGLLVRVSVDSRITGPLNVEPAVLTPNGDGINDAAVISYTVYHLLEPAPVEISIYDLAGSRIRRLPSQSVANGRYEALWDGRGRGGSPVPPGAYLVEVTLESDRTTERRARLVLVAY